LLLALRLHEALRPGGSLKDLMRDLSRKAQERGLTPEVLDALLREP
jgi:Flp pilus assembly protein TadB